MRHDPPRCGIRLAPFDGRALGLRQRLRLRAGGQFGLATASFHAPDLSMGSPDTAEEVGGFCCPVPPEPRFAQAFIPVRELGRERLLCEIIVRIQVLARYRWYHAERQPHLYYARRS
jgi:hypothetical protein